MCLKLCLCTCITISSLVCSTLHFSTRLLCGTEYSAAPCFLRHKDRNHLTWNYGCSAVEKIIQLRGSLHVCDLLRFQAFAFYFCTLCSSTFATEIFFDFLFTLTTSSKVSYYEKYDAYFFFLCFRFLHS